MRSLQDVVYNWLTIKLVADNRPQDAAAIETTQFFWKMLTEDHKVKDVQINKTEEMYLVMCTLEEGNRSFRFPSELIDCINDQIVNEPEKFPNFSE